jgi:hypothetical protein
MSSVFAVSTRNNGIKKYTSDIAAEYCNENNCAPPTFVLKMVMWLNRFCAARNGPTHWSRVWRPKKMTFPMPRFGASTATRWK